MLQNMDIFYDTQSTIVVGMLLIVSFTIPTTRSSAGCTYGKIPPMAVIGQELNLHCNLGVNETCISGVYEWYHLNSSQKDAIAERSKTLRIADTVTSAEEVGGQLYECHCSRTEYCRTFKIGVKPRVTLNVSSPVAKTGSSVNVTCMAESYPLANSVDNFQMKHPLNTLINRTFLPMHGVVHIIAAASKERDAGIYECAVSVTLEEYTTPLQSDNVRANLLIYDPPVIVHVHNFTIYDLEQSAILECVIRNLEHDLKVWTNWTTSEGKMITKKHVMFPKGNAYYLVVYNATAEDFTCQVFSTHSPDTPEDSKVVSVLMSETPSSPTTRGLSTKSENITRSKDTSQCKLWYIITDVVWNKNGEELRSTAENAIPAETETQASAERDNDSAVQRNPSASQPVPSHRQSVTSSSLRSKSLPIGSPPRRGLRSSSPRKSSSFFPLHEEHLTQGHGKPVASDPDPYYIHQHSEEFNFTNESITSGAQTTPGKVDSTLETKPTTAFPTKIRNPSVTGARQRSQSLYVGSPPSRLLRSIQHVPLIKKASVSSSVDPGEKETLISEAHNEEKDNHSGTGVHEDDHHD